MVYHLTQLVRSLIMFPKTGHRAGFHRVFRVLQNFAAYATPRRARSGFFKNRQNGENT